MRDAPAGPGTQEPMWIDREQGLEGPERIVERGVGDKDVELLPPTVPAPTGDRVVAVELVIGHVPAELGIHGLNR